MTCRGETKNVHLEEREYVDSIQTIYQDKIENKIEIENNDQTEIVQLDDVDDEIEIVKSTVQRKEKWEVTVSDIFNAREINFAYGSSKPAGTLPLPRPRA